MYANSTAEPNAKTYAKTNENGPSNEEANEGSNEGATDRAPVPGRGKRTALALVGGTVLILGTVAIVRPRVAERVPVEPVIAMLGNAYLLVAVFGVLALLVVATLLVARAIGGIDQTSPPDPEDVHPVPRFGESFDEFVADAGVRAWLLEDRHEEVRGRLRESAIATVMRESNCTRPEARQRIDEGSWTEDPDVGAFLAEEALGSVLVRARDRWAR